MMMLSGLCLLGFFASMAGLSVLMVLKFNGPPKVKRPPPLMLDLAPPIASSGPWSDPPDSLQHPMLPTLLPNTGWLGVLISTPKSAGPTERITVVGLVRVPADQLASLGKLEVVFESRSTGERVSCTPTFIGPAIGGPPSKPVGFERATRAEREQAVTVGFFVTRAMLGPLPSAEYRVSAHVDFAHSNEQRLELSAQFG
jgi:hypothetical protein